MHFAKAALQYHSDHPTHTRLGLVRTQNGTAAAGSSNNAEAAVTVMYMHLHYMASRAAAILDSRESEDLLIARLMATAWDAHSHLLTTIWDFK